MLAEAIIDWYENLSYKALDRVTRVQVLSGAMRYREMYAIASTWKAHIQFETSDFDGMCRSLELSFQNRTEDNADANTRLAIVLTSAFSLCGDLVNAKVWFVKGRGYALAEGDQASVEALQYNRAVFALTSVRLESCIDAVSQERLRAVRREIDSTSNLNFLTRIPTLANHLHLAEARLLLLEGEYKRAILALESVRNETPFAAYHFSQFAINLEIAYCKFRLNEIEQAFELFSPIDFSSLADMDVDEQLVASHLHLEMASMDARFGDLNELRHRKSERLSAHLKSLSDLAAGLQPFATERPLS
jgi:hypothetical protein